MPVTHCPSCGLSLSAAPVAEGLNAARCSSCRTLVDLGAADAPRSPVGAARPQAPIPEDWQVEATPGGLSVRWRWFGFEVLLLLVFTLFWDGVLISFAAGATEGFAHPERLLFGLVLPHVWVGFALSYYVLARFINTTAVTIEGGELAVRHAPLWWPGQRCVPARDVQQLFVLEKRGAKGSRSYELCAMMRDGMRRSLVPGLSDLAEARFLEVRLEQALGLVDRPIAGELRAR
jgi:hypothetical protein